jgi:hypothetical protein
MSPVSPKNEKPPEVNATAAAAPPDAAAPERVRKPHYDWEHEGAGEVERLRVKPASRVSAKKKDAEA